MYRLSHHVRPQYSMECSLLRSLGPATAFLSPLWSVTCLT